MHIQRHIAYEANGIKMIQNVSNAKSHTFDFAGRPRAKPAGMPNLIDQVNSN